VARFDDYAKQEQGDTELDTEIADASKQSDERRDEGATALPERFKGKKPEEIAHSYVELEKAYSRQGQDIGRLRKTVDEMLELQLRSPLPGQDKPSTKPVEAADLFDNPDAAVRGVAKEEVDARVKSLEAELMNERLARAKADFTKSFPTWEEDVRNPEFINWIQEKAHRVRLARDADMGDFGAAETLFGTYYDQRDARKAKETKAERKARVQEVTLESAGAGAPDLEQKFSRAALMEKRLAAKRGDRNADYWLKSNAESIAIAYEEGRIVD
jgi:hypothetical protein